MWAQGRPALGEAACGVGLRESLLSLRVGRERDFHNPAGHIKEFSLLATGEASAEPLIGWGLGRSLGGEKRDGRSASPRKPPMVPAAAERRLGGASPDAVALMTTLAPALRYQ